MGRPLKEDLTGRRFNRLEVLRHAARGNGFWDVRCDCGTLKTIGGRHLVKGETKSCGCYRKEATSVARRALTAKRKQHVVELHARGVKQCRKCKEEKPLNCFMPSRRTVEGLYSYCRECTSGFWLKNTYGIDASDKRLLISKQRETCANTGCDTRVDIKSSLDHNHTTGKVRGVLCNPCNVSLGQLGECPARIAGLLTYLSGHPDTTISNRN